MRPLQAGRHTRCRGSMPSHPAPGGTAMDLGLSVSEQAFRDGLRAWLEVHCPRDWARRRLALSGEEQARVLIDWQQQLHAAGYVGLHWPVEHGGRGATVME